MSAMDYPAQDGAELRARTVREWRERIITAHEKAMTGQALRVRATYLPSADFVAASKADHAMSKMWAHVLVRVFDEIEDALEEAHAQAIHDNEEAA